MRWRTEGKKGRGGRKEREDSLSCCVRSLYLLPLKKEKGRTEEEGPVTNATIGISLHFTAEKGGKGRKERKR